MLRELNTSLSAARAFKIERARSFTTHRVPEFPVSLEALKVVEQQLRKRALVCHASSDAFYPLWFLAETERNVFLWQHQFSLADLQLFHFFIDIEALIEKRLRHISGGNSFNNLDSSFDQAEHSQSWRNQLEHEYLQSVQQTLTPLMPHLSALSSTFTALQQSKHAAHSPVSLVLPYRPSDKNSALDSRAGR